MMFMVFLQTYRWRGRAVATADDQPASSHSCRCSLCLLVLLQAACLPYSGQVYKSSLICIEQTHKCWNCKSYSTSRWSFDFLQVQGGLLSSAFNFLLWTLSRVCVCVCIWVCVGMCACVQHSRAGAADGHVAQLDDQRGRILWEVRSISVWQWGITYFRFYFIEWCKLKLLESFKILSFGYVTLGTMTNQSLRTTRSLQVNKHFALRQLFFCSWSLLNTSNCRRWTEII